MTLVKNGKATASDLLDHLDAETGHKRRQKWAVNRETTEYLVDKLRAAQSEIATLKAENAALKARQQRRKQLRKLFLSRPRTRQ